MNDSETVRIGLETADRVSVGSANTSFALESLRSNMHQQQHLFDRVTGSAKDLAAAIRQAAEFSGQATESAGLTKASSEEAMKFTESVLSDIQALTTVCDSTKQNISRSVSRQDSPIHHGSDSRCGGSNQFARVERSDRGGPRRREWARLLRWWQTSPFARRRTAESTAEIGNMLTAIFVQHRTNRGGDRRAKRAGGAGRDRCDVGGGKLSDIEKPGDYRRSTSEHDECRNLWFTLSNLQKSPTLLTRCSSRFKASAPT